MQVTFFLDTTGEHFARWLENYTSDAPYRHFSSERGRIALQRARGPYSITGPTNIEMEGVYIKPSTNNDTEVAQPLPRIILFKVVPLAPTRLEVTAKCTQPVVMDYFKELLMATIERWPEAQQRASVEAGSFEHTLSEPWREMVARARLEILAAFSREEQGVKSETIGAPPAQAEARLTLAFDRVTEGAALERELAQRKRNLYKLRKQAAIYAAGETPLHLLNQIEAEEMEIRRIEEQLSIEGLNREGAKDAKE
jgi:hypothetical protein